MGILARNNQTERDYRQTNNIMWDCGDSGNRLVSHSFGCLYRLSKFVDEYANFILRKKEKGT